MTVSSTIRKAGPYLGNGVTASFSFGFKVFLSSDVTVTQLDIASGTEIAYPNTFTVTLNSNQESNPGGTVLLQYPLEATKKIIIGSSVPYLQPVALTNSGGFYPEVLNSALDRLTILAQQLSETGKRVLSLSLFTDSSVSPELPAPVSSSFLGWDATGSKIINYAGLASASISSFMSGVVSSANAAAAQVALGATTLGQALFAAGSQSAAQSALGVYSNAQVDAAIAPLGGFRNRVMNGDFSIDQENAGASQTITAGAALKYVLDGWYAYCTGANITFQQVTVGNRKRARFTGAASNTGLGFGHRIESANSADMVNVKATLSVLLSSSSITTANWALYYANSVNAFGTVASPTRTSIQSGSFTITSTEAAYSAITSAVLASGATTGLEIVITTGALTATNTLTIGDVQIERGSVASPVFESVETMQQLVRCQRRLRKKRTAAGIFASTTAVDLFIEHEGMFAAPTPSTSAALVITDSISANYTQSSGNISSVTTTADGGRYQCVNFTGATAARAAGLYPSGGFILFRAEIP